MDYFIGFDIGTDSVGWAVTDPQYRVMKKNGKALWGVRLFDEEQKAEERRMQRTSRRRLERRNQRIKWLQQVFSEEIAKVDPAFFLRLEESKFLQEDKKTAPNGAPLGRYTLFADRSYCDKDYHRDYPTIYHLRKALITEDHPFDVRLVYLACHHILKNRGHFLWGEMNLEEVSFDNLWAELCQLLLDEYDCELDISDLSQFKNVLTDRNMYLTEKKKQLRELAGVKKTEVQICAVLDLLAGGKVRPSDVCGTEIEKEADTSFSFRENFENAEGSLCDTLGESMQLVYAIKKVYDWSVLDELRDGEVYLSQAKVKVYDQHRRDLSELKILLKVDRAVYKEVFCIAKDKVDNYPAYSGHGAENHRCDAEAFYKFLKKKLEQVRPKLNHEMQAQCDEIMRRMALGTFLPKQTTKDNGVIPHQLHEQELKAILQKASTYLPFLNEKDESGLSRKEQIMQVFRFRIPYYVGPLHTKSEHGWIVRSNEKITPWNFEKVVDLEKSAENFIGRMTATCSYIGEPVLPKDSLLYSRFVALNMLNKLQINGHPISVEKKQKIYTEHLLKKGKSTLTSLKEFLLSEGMMEKGDEISGLDEGFKLQMQGYKVFERILRGGQAYDMVEDIIKHIALFGEDKKLFTRWLKKTYGHVLAEEDQRYVVHQCGKFSGWGNLSREFLTEIKHADPETGELLSITDALWQTNDNLMELLSARYTFAEGVQAYREKKFGLKGRTLDDVLKDSYASPGIRRAIHQTMLILSEVEKIMHGEPKRVFVEVTRKPEEKKQRTVSRKEQLKELYAACKKEAPEFFERQDGSRRYEALQACEESELRSAKLYLYYTQMGKCMYSGEPIDLSRLDRDYDIDHIYPQSRVKDDSLSNRVLVKKQLNAQKSNNYPISKEIRENMHGFWAMLKARKFISTEKYRRLTRSDAFEPDELSGFIARQIVETSQACKIVAELLKQRYEGRDRVVYSKASNVSAFRQDQRVLPDGTQRQAWTCKGISSKQDPVFIKCREVNDFHHAKDAYLNIVVGNVYHMKFTNNPLNFINRKQEYSLNRMFDFDVERNGECAWKAGEEGSIAIVRKMMRKNNILFTRYAHEAGGELFDQMIRPKNQGQAMIKSSDSRMTIDKFGGYNKRTGAYFCLVEHTEKKKRIRSIESVLLMYKDMYEADPLAYCQAILELKEPKIIVKKILINAMVSLNGFRMHISGRTGDRIILKNANQLVVAPEEAAYIKQIGKYLERCKKAHCDLEITSYDAITEEQNKALYQLLLDKLQTARYAVKYETPAKTLTENQNKFEELNLSDQCKVLMQVLNLFNTTAASADLKLLCGKAGIGILLMSKNLETVKNQDLQLIHQSVTGVFEKKINLLGEEK